MTKAELLEKLLEIRKGEAEVFEHMMAIRDHVNEYEINDKKIVSENIVDTNGSGHGALASFLKEKNVVFMSEDFENMWEHINKKTFILYYKDFCVDLNHKFLLNFKIIFTPEFIKFNYLFKFSL